jgi:hypothetical protein
MSLLNAGLIERAGDIPPIKPVQVKISIVF